MLQYIASNSSRYSIAEQCQMVIEGGCKWVEIYLPGENDNEVKNAALDVIEVCRETDTFLLIHDHVDVVEELRVSGVRLSSVKDAAGVRDRLGANAIIGVEVSTYEEIESLRTADIDYVTVSNKTPAELKEIADKVKAADLGIAVVALGGVTLENVEDVFATGVNGIAVGSAILQAADPMLRTSQFLEKIIPVKE